MHLSEFKAWFDGYTEEMDGVPNIRQWKKIKSRVAEITNDYTPSPIFIDRHVRPYRRYWDDIWHTSLSADGTGNAPSLTDWSNAGRAEYRAT